MRICSRLSRLDHTVTPSPHHPIGVKGVGETGTIASTPTVYNAVIDALRPFGIEQIDMPMTPYRVWKAIQAQAQERRRRIIMWPKQFEYTRASSVAEAVNLLAGHEGAKLLAGGHSLIPALKLRLNEPHCWWTSGASLHLKISPPTARSKLVRWRPMRSRVLVAGAGLCPCLGIGRRENWRSKRYVTLGLSAGTSPMLILPRPTTC